MDNLSLDEILSLRCFNQYYDYSSEFFCSSKIVTDWAENQVIQGNESETLLIIASLGIDKQIDNNEVIFYLDRYLFEKNIPIPEINYSCLIVMKLLFQQIISCKTLDDIGHILYNFVFKYMDFGNQYFHNIRRYWEFIYYDYFDMYVGLDCYYAEKQLSEDYRYTDIKNKAKKFCQFLSHHEMVIFLAKHS